MSNPHEQPNLSADNEDPDGWATWAIGIGGAFIVIATVAATCGIFYSAATTEAFEKNVNIRYEERNMVIAAQQAVLEEAAHWESVKNTDDNKSIDRFVIPIDQAMDIIAGNTK